MSDIKTWDIPTGIAADSTVRLAERIADYMESHNTIIAGCKVRPHVATVKMIIECFDEFGSIFPVAVSHDSYSYVTEIQHS